MHSYQARILINTYGDGNPTMALRPDGSAHRFLTTSSTLPRVWQANVGNRDALVELRDADGALTGWQYAVAADDSLETYDAAGKLQSIKARNGWLTTLSYSNASTPTSIAPAPGLLVSAKNHFGRELRFIYNAQSRLTEVLPPGAAAGTGAGASTSPIRYAYDESASLSGVPSQGQLTSVTWQDGAVRRYHYEDRRFPHALTGITDEAGVRYAAYSYDASRRVIRAEHAGGVDRVDFAYASGQTTVTDYSGAAGSATQRTYTFANQGGVLRPTGVSAPCPLCGSTQQSSSYDAAGLLTKTIAHDGKVSFYKYDTKGRETERATYAASYASASTRPALNLAESVTSTKWHATWTLPTQIAEPGKITSYTYSARGMTGQSWTATTDATGAAKFNAVKTGSTYATGYGYNANSLVTSVVQRTDSVETQRWTLAYNASGDVTRITEPSTGKVAQATSYDAHGALTAGTDLDGAAVTFTYSSRGYLTQERYDAMTTTYARNQIGLPTSVATPATTLTVSYDPAQRVIAISSDIRLPQGRTTSMRRPSLALPEWIRRYAMVLIPSAYAQVAVEVPTPIGGVLSPRSDRANRGAWDDLAGPRPMTLADQCTVALSRAFGAVGSAIGALTKAEACPEEPPTPGGKDCDDRCKMATNDARRQYYRLVTKRLPEYLSGGSRGSDVRHYNAVKQLQRALEKSAQRVRLYCNPLPTELPEWERAAAMSIPILH